MTYLDAIHQVRRRVRDPHGTAHTEALVRDLLWRAAIVTNIRGRYVTEARFFTVEPRQVFYGPISLLLPDVARIIGFHDGAHPIPRVSWSRYQHVSGHWFRQVGPQIQQWDYVGQDMIVLYPALDYRYELECYDTPLFREPGTSRDTFPIPDQYVSTVLDVVEVQLLAKQRSLGPVLDSAFARVMGRVGQNVQSQRSAADRRAIQSASRSNDE